MEINEIIQLMQAASDCALTSFQMTKGDVSFSLTKGLEKTVMATGEAEASSWEALAETDVISSASVGSNAAASAGKQAQTAAVSTGMRADQVVSSPLVGIFYAAPSPEAENFVKVGDRVKKGQVLGIVEAMKLMNEIESEYDGVVEAILVNNEDVVEYGQPMFRIGGQ